jgi:hypothetical protein
MHKTREAAAIFSLAENECNNRHPLPRQEGRAGTSELPVRDRNPLSARRLPPGTSASPGALSARKALG